MKELGRRDLGQVVLQVGLQLVLQVVGPLFRAEPLEYRVLEGTLHVGERIELEKLRGL